MAALLGLGAALGAASWVAAAEADAETADAVLPAALAGKIDPALWQRVRAGEVSELLVEYDDPAIDADARALRKARRLRVDDAAMLELRAARYRLLKRRALRDLAADEAEALKDYRHIPMSLHRLKNARVLKRLLARTEVKAVHENEKLPPALSQSLPLVEQDTVVQQLGRTGAGYSVAVLDSGVTYTRSEFGGCTAPGVPASCRVVAAFDAAREDNKLDALGHGTWVAGTVAAMAPGADIVAIDVFDGSGAPVADVIEGIDWAIAHRDVYHIAAINLSIATGYRKTTACTTDSHRAAIIRARDAGILTTVASGNGGYTDGISSPACIPEAISVGAVFDANITGTFSFTDSASGKNCSVSKPKADQVTCYANSASFLTLLAPGSKISVTGSVVNGTSFAAPHVAGAIAVLKESFPTETPDQILGRLTAGGQSIADYRNGIVKPRLDLYAAHVLAPNDLFANALALSGTQGSTSGMNEAAGKEGGEPDHAGNPGGRSVWWQWTAPAAGTLNLDTHGSGFDTLLAVYTGGAVGALTPVAANDDDGAPGGASGLSFAAQAGTTYRIAVDGLNGAGGDIGLHWSLRQAQAIDFAPIPDQFVEATLTLAASASSGLPVSYSAAPAGVCTVNGNVASFSAAGDCTLTARQAGDVGWLPAPEVGRSFAVLRRAQAISFAPIDQQVWSASFTVNASATSGLPVTLSSDTPEVCAVVGNLASMTGVGTCTLSAQQAGNGAWLPAPQVQRSFSVVKRAQAITAFAVPEQMAMGDAAAPVSASADSGLAVALYNDTPGICALAAGMVSPLAGGTCILRAEQSGDAYHEAAAGVSRSFAIRRYSQTLQVEAIADVPLGSPPWAPPVTASSGLPVGLVSLAPEVCGVDAEQRVSVLAIGTCNLRASQPGDAQYDPAPDLDFGFTVREADTPPAGEEGGSDGDVPLPPWALLLLGGGLYALLARRR